MPMLLELIILTQISMLNTQSLTRKFNTSYGYVTRTHHYDLNKYVEYSVIGKTIQY